jgi:hypothetical protein
MDANNLLYEGRFQPLPTNLVCKYIPQMTNTIKKTKKYLKVLRNNFDCPSKIFCAIVKINKRLTSEITPV